MYYTACLLLQWQLLCQAIVGLVYKWEGLLKIVWGGCNPLKPPPPPLDPPLPVMHASVSYPVWFPLSHGDKYDYKGHNLSK